MSLKAVFISDTHNYHAQLELPDGDILIHTGDFTLTGTINECVDFRDWFQAQPHPYKIVIAGNHDRVIGESEMLGFKLFTDSHYLERSSVEIEGIKFWGSPFTPSFNGMRSGLTFYTNSDQECKDIWRGMPSNADVILTHGPPLGILDQVDDLNEYGQPAIRNCGDGMLASKIIKNKPKYHAFGHIHEGYGTFRALYGTIFINGSSVNYKYDLVNKPIVVDIKTIYGNITIVIRAER